MDEPGVSTLTFVVPVRHQANARDWNELKRNLAQTLRSFSSQSAHNWRAVVVANHGADLPALPPRVEAVRVDFPPNPLHERGTAEQEAFYDAVRLDKGRRILAGLLHAGRDGYVMVVDDDDLVSNRLADFVARHESAPGWYVQRGYFWPTAGRMLYAHGDFSRYCGSSHIVRANLYDLPTRFEDASAFLVTRLLGSHVFLEEHLRARGTPLAPLPFPGAVYRIGHAGSHSRSRGIVRTFFLTRRNARNPLRLLAAALRLRLLTPRIRGEFFGCDGLAGPPGAAVSAPRAARTPPSRAFKERG